MAGLIAIGVIALFLLLVAFATVKIIPKPAPGSSSGSGATTARSIPAWRSSCPSSIASAR